jgi:hypothetical protein
MAWGTFAAALAGVGITLFATAWKVTDDRSDLRRLERIAPLLKNLEENSVASVALNDAANTLALQVAQQRMVKLKWAARFGVVYFPLFGALEIAAWFLENLAQPGTSPASFWLGVGSLAFTALPVLFRRSDRTKKRDALMTRWRAEAASKPSPTPSVEA